MGRHFDYRDWDFDEICDSIRERIADTKRPIPPKVWKHYVSIVYRTSECSYQYSHHLYWPGQYPDFKTREDAEKYLAACSWLEKRGDNMWVEIPERGHYTDKDGNEVPCHYEIRESDSEVYEDGEYYYLYTDEEKKLLSEALYAIEKARAYIRAYDYCCDQCSFGEGSFAEEVKEELEKFEKEYTEELPEDYHNDDD